MYRIIINNIVSKITFLTIAIMLFTNLSLIADYCEFIDAAVIDSGATPISINLVKFNGKIVQKWDFPRDQRGRLLLYNAPNYYGYKDIDHSLETIYVDKGSEYTMELYGGGFYLINDSTNSIDEYVNVESWNATDFKVYIDINHNDKFDADELVGEYNTEDFESWGSKFQVKIPIASKSGKTTMRIVSDIYCNNGDWGPFDACNSAWGEAKDFSVYIQGGVDVGISRITSPTSPLKPGVQDIKAILTNYSSTLIKKCTIIWSVNGIKQTPVEWSGNLDANQEAEVTLGNYEFKSTGGTSMYEIAAKTENPNGIVDEFSGNDAAPKYVVAMPISPGTYYVGGIGYDFEKLLDLIDIINFAGIADDGDFIIKIRPGNYFGPFTLDNFNHGNNKFVFEADEATPGNINITANTTEQNYVWYINNISNVTFRNLTFSVNDPDKNGGRIFMLLGKTDNYTFENNTFNGVSDFDEEPFKYALIDCRARNINNHRYIKNTFKDGFMSLSLIDDSFQSSGLLINNNKFNSFSNRAIHVEGIADAVISNNLLIASPNLSEIGILVYNGKEISNNKLSGMVGFDANMSAGIVVVNDATSKAIKINNNTISACSDINGIVAIEIKGGEIKNNSIDLLNSNFETATNGILVSNSTSITEQTILSENTVKIENGMGVKIENYNTDLLKNKINVTNSGSSLMLQGISTANSKGMILMNEVICSGEVMNINNGNFTIAYNSTLGLGSAAVITIEKGDNILVRNQLINQQTGNVFSISDKNSAFLDGNNYLTKSRTIGTIEGTIYTDFSQLLSIDSNARYIDPKYKAKDNLKITEYKEELIFESPLTKVVWPEGYQSNYEETTLDGKPRNGAYYVGAYNVFPVVNIIHSTKELINCAGAKDMAVVCSGKANYGAEPKYQWYKDDVKLPGETKHILNFPQFDYRISGIYKCKVYAAGVANPLWSEPIPVYALTTPEITDQPKEVINAKLGGTYNFEVKAHYRGLVPPYYEDFFQWFKYTAATGKLTALQNNERFGGVTSSKLVISDLADTDICEKGDYYFVEIISQCGTIRSNPFIISQKPDVVFRDNPKDVNICPNSDIVFEAFAIAPDGFKVTYSWQKDGVDLTNNEKYNGANTNKLQIFNANHNEAGAYKCVAQIVSENITVISAPGKLTLKEEPNATYLGQADYTVKRGNDLTMQINLVGGTQPLKIKWSFKGEVLKEGTWDEFNGNALLALPLQAIEEYQAGEYICTVENECAVKELKFNLTVTKWDEASSVEVITENGYSLYTAIPNPANEVAKVNYIVPKSGLVRFTLSDLSGRVIRCLFDGYAVAGMNTLEINIKQLNLPAGVYFYTMTADNFSGVRSLVILE